MILKWIVNNKNHDGDEDSNWFYVPLIGRESSEFFREKKKMEKFSSIPKDSPFRIHEYVQLILSLPLYSWHT